MAHSIFSSRIDALGGVAGKDSSSAVHSSSEGVKIYVDDITVFSNNREEHIYHVMAVSRRLTRLNIPIRVNKCRFSQKNSAYLDS